MSRLAGPALLLTAVSVYCQTAPPQDVGVDAIEVVQVVQDAANSIPLIAGKKTVARVFASVKASENPVPQGGAACTLRGFRDSEELPGTPLPIGASPVIVPVAPADREQTGHSFNFELPAEWTQAGSLELRAELSFPGQLEDSNTANNSLAAAPVRFIETKFPKPFVNAAVRVCVQPDLASQTCPAGAAWPNPDRAQQVVGQLFPLPEGGTRSRALSRRVKLWPGALTLDNSGEVFDWLQKMRAQFAALGREGADAHFTALLPEGTAIRLDDRRLAPGLARLNGLVSFVVTQANAEAAAFNQAHETAHAVGLEHPGTPDDGDAVGGRAGYWQQQPDNRSAAIQEVGFDTTIGQAVPRARFDLMSYRAPQWISPFHYRKLIDAQALFAGLATKQDGAVEVAILSGWVARDGSAGGLDPAFRFRTLSPALPATRAGAETCFRFFEDGRQTGEHCFQPDYADSNGFTPDRFRFALPVVVPASSTRVALFRGPAELGSLAEAGAPNPTVLVTSPQTGARLQGAQRIAWSASSADQRALATAIHYSTDGGTTWEPWDVDPGRAELGFNAADLPAGEDVYLRVVVSSGWNNASNTIGPLTVLPSPRAEVSAASFDFGAVNPGESSERIVSVASTGNTALTVNSLQVEGSAFALATPGTGRIEPDASATFRLRFQPTSGGVHQGALLIGSSDPDKPAIRIPLEGTSTGPASSPRIALSPASLDFGPVTIGQSRDMPLEIRNTGDGPLTVNSIASSDARFILPGLLFPLRIAAGEFRAVSVRFSPVTAADFQGSLAIASNDAARPSVSVAVSGRGETANTGQPRLDITPAALQFGSVAVGQTRDLTLTIRNVGTQVLGVAQFQISNPVFQIVSPGAAATTLAAGAQLVMTVRFAPTAASSIESALTILSNDPDRPQVSIGLSGAGTASGQAVGRIEVSPATVDFATVTVGEVKSVTLAIRNTGAGILNITQIAVSGNPFAVTAPATPIGLNPGGSLSLTVRMTPAGAGTQTGTLTIRSSDPSNGILTVPLTGLARGVVNETLRVDDGTYETFATQPRGDMFYINRLTPPAYPARLTAIRVYWGRDTIPAGQGITIVWSGHDGAPELSLVRLRSQAGRAGREDGYTEYSLGTPVTITSGDFLVGFVDGEGGRRTVALDTNSGFRERSYASTDGVSFQPLNRVPDLGIGNFGIQAVVTVDIR